MPQVICSGMLYLMEWCGVILVVVIPASTLLAGHAALNSKEQEDRSRNKTGL